MSNAEHESLPFFKDALLAAGVLTAPRSGRLYHYTSEEGARGILNQQVLWATDAACFRDTSEYTFGLGLLDHALERIEAAGYGGLIRPWVKELLADRGGWTLYVSCYCEDGNSEHQWRRYADGGHGVVLGFDALEVSRKGAAALLRVSYGENSVREVQARLTDWLISELDARQSVRDEVLATDAEGLLTAYLATMLLTVVASKEEGYAQEREYRLVHLHHRSRPIDPAKLMRRVVDNREVRYVLLPLRGAEDGAPAVISIEPGPARSGEEDERRFRALAELAGLAR